MNIVVCIKQVPDTAAKIQERVADGRIDLESVEWVANPYDEYGVEEALRLTEAHGGQVTLITLGPDRAVQALKDMLALGADEGIHIKDPLLDNVSRRGVAKALAAAIRKLDDDVDMVWTGWKGMDEDHGLVPAYLAEELGWPHLSFVQAVDVDPDAGRVTVEREAEGGKEVLEAPLPAVLSAQKGLNEVRYASLKGIMAVKKKTIPEWTASDLGLDASELEGPDVELVHVGPPPERQPGRILDGTPEETAKELVRLLREEAKII
ncbi:MAG: Electron transfer flavoprotein subunit beta [Anaerolineales bacterium]|nr:Electron transfer flavoprotein subunit beta [Anaerolineales bacterium]